MKNVEKLGVLVFGSLYFLEFSKGLLQTKGLVFWAPRTRRMWSKFRGDHKDAPRALLLDKLEELVVFTNILIISFI